MNEIVLENTLLSLLKFTPGLGRVHVYKALLMIDAFYYAYFKESLTGITYIKDWYGPVPDFKAKNAISNFKSIYHSRQEIFDFSQFKHFTKQSPDYSVFKNEEETLEIIRTVAQFVNKKWAKQLSELTHDEAYYSANMGEVIPLEAIYKITTKAEAWTKKEKELLTKDIEEISQSANFDLSSYCR